MDLVGNLSELKKIKNKNYLLPSSKASKASVRGKILDFSPVSNESHSSRILRRKC